MRLDWKVCLALSRKLKLTCKPKVALGPAVIEHAVRLKTPPMALSTFSTRVQQINKSTNLPNPQWSHNMAKKPPPTLPPTPH